MKELYPENSEQFGDSKDKAYGLVMKYEVKIKNPEKMEDLLEEIQEDEDFRSKTKYEQEKEAQRRFKILKDLQKSKPSSLNKDGKERYFFEVFGRLNLNHSIILLNKNYFELDSDVNLDDLRKGVDYLILQNTQVKRKEDASGQIRCYPFVPSFSFKIGPHKNTSLNLFPTFSTYGNNFVNNKYENSFFNILNNQPKLNLPQLVKGKEKINEIITKSEENNEFVKVELEAVPVCVPKPRVGPGAFVPGTRSVGSITNVCNGWAFPKNNLFNAEDLEMLKTLTVENPYLLDEESAPYFDLLESFDLRKKPPKRIIVSNKKIEKKVKKQLHSTDYSELTFISQKVAFEIHQNLQIDRNVFEALQLNKEFQEINDLKTDKQLNFDDYFDQEGRNQIKIFVDFDLVDENGQTGGSKFFGAPRIIQDDLLIGNRFISVVEKPEGNNSNTEGIFITNSNQNINTNSNNNE